MSVQIGTILWYNPQYSTAMRNLLLLIFSISFPFVLPQQGFGQQADSITLYFDFNRSDTTRGTDSILTRYFHATREHYIIQSISLSGFCDNIGSDGFNDMLSMKRALAVKSYLAGTWLDTANIKEVHGFGKRHPLNDNQTEEQRSMNRRVMLVLQKTPLTPPAADRPLATPDSSKTSVSAILKDTATTIGTSVILKNVNFYGGRHFPLDSSYPALDDLLRAMKENPKLIIRIEGHVCCIPESMDGPDIDTHQPNLSVTRARFVYDYLMEHGVDSARMSYLGLGASNKLYPEERTPNEQTLNRRVEVRVMAK
jgi:outer membrane protein OmpA-like peptidoglycan-associated protein